MEESTIHRLEVVFQDPFDFKEVYKYVFYWLVDNNYVDNRWKGGIDDATSEEDLEIFYDEEYKLGGIREYRVWWRASKPGDSPYFRWKLNVDFQGLAIRDTEVVKNDKKYKMNIGELTIRLKAILVTEAHGRWDKNTLTNSFRKWFTEKWYRSKIEEQEDLLYEDLYRLQNDIKQYLEMHQWEERPQQFFNPKGFN